MISALYLLSMSVVLLAMAVTLPPFAFLWLPVAFGALHVFIVLSSATASKLARGESALCIMFAIYAIVAHNSLLPQVRNVFMVYYLAYAVLHVIAGATRIALLDE